MRAISKSDLIRDLHIVAEDLEQLVQAAAHQGGERVLAARHRAEQWVRSVKGRLNEVERQVVLKAKSAAHGADAYVRDHAWESIATAAQAGIVVGSIGRRISKDTH